MRASKDLESEQQHCCIMQEQNELLREQNNARE